MDKLESKLATETEQVNEISWELRSRRRQIDLLYPGFLSKNLALPLRQTFRPSFAVLSAEYSMLVRRLTRQYPEVLSRTASEVRLVNEIKRQTKFAVHPSVWIGNVNVDLLIPSIGGVGVGRTFQGLVIEVDGGVHDREHKMRKDNHKYMLLHGLKLSVMSVPNKDIRHPLVAKAVSEIQRMRRLDTRAVKRVWTRVYLETLVRHLPDAEFSKLFIGEPRGRRSSQSVERGYKS